MADERREKVICLLRTHVLESVIAATIAALVGLLTRIELRIDEEAVLQTIDPDLRGFLVVDRAEVSQHLQTPPVRFRNHRLQLRTSDVHVRLEGRDAMVRPEVHRLTGIFGPGQNWCVQTRTAQKGSGDVQVRAGSHTFLNSLLEVQIRLRRDATRGAYRRDAVRQVKPWR